MKTKKELRREFSAKRAAAKNELKDGIIAARLLSMERVLNADTVLLFASFGSEVNTWNMAENLLRKGKKIAYPICLDAGEMEFCLVSSLDQLSDGSESQFGICEPDLSLPKPELSGRTVCIIPAMALTPKGGRLGYGGGYYDKYFASHPEIYTIAPAYESVITDELPQAEHDLRVDAIVTEERIVLCNE